MKWLVTISIVWRLCLTVAGTSSVGIYPGTLYYGGLKTKATLTCQPSEDCADSVKWFFGQNQIDTTESKYSTSVNFLTNYLTLSITGADEEDDGYYHCQCTFSGKAYNSPDAQLVYTEPVSFDTEDNIVYEEDFGGNVTLYCDIKNYIEFQWQFVDKTVVPSNSNKYKYLGTNLFISNLSVNDNTTYYCAGNNQITNINKLAAQVVVFKQPNVVADGDSDIEVDEGESVTLNCTADGHPRPKVIWSRSGGALTIGGRISKTEEVVDQFTVRSHLTIKHLSTSDNGQYLCTGQSSILNKQASFGVDYDIEVIEPPGPFFQLFTIDKSHSSINISWILSGVSSDMIKITWGAASESDQSQVHFANTSSVVIIDISPSTLYLITAEVIDTQLSDSVNETTDPEIVSSSVTSSSTLGVDMSGYSSHSSTSLLQRVTSSATSVSVVDQRSTADMNTNVRQTRTTQSQVEPTARGSRADSGITGAIVPVIVVLVLVVIILFTVFALVCVIKRKRHSKAKNFQSIERANSSRSSEVLLTGNGSFVNLQSGSSNPSLTILSGHITNNSEMDFLYKRPPDSISAGNTSSSHVSQVKHPISNENFYTIGSSDEPFEMTDNPGHSEYEVTQSSQFLGTPTMTYNESFDDGRFFPAGDSVSQVIFTSQSHNMFEPYNQSQPPNQSFDYSSNSCYEVTPAHKPNKKSQSEPPMASHGGHSVAGVLYENNFANKPPKSPKFGIVESGRRGVVREQVEIKHY